MSPKRSYRLFSRFLALSLGMAVALSSPAFALRPETPTETGLEEALRMDLQRAGPEESPLKTASDIIRVLDLLRNRIRPAASDEVVVRAFIRELDETLGPRLPQAQLNLLTAHRGYFPGAFRRRDVEGMPEEKELLDGFLGDARRVVEHAGLQMGLPRDQVLKLLEWEAVERLARALYMARDLRGTLLLRDVSVETIARWFYRDLPQRIVPRVARHYQRALTETKALENPFGSANRASNLAMADLILRQLQAGRLMDEPEQLQRDPSLIKPWISLLLASNLVDQSQPKVLEEISREPGSSDEEKLQQYVLRHAATPFAWGERNEKDVERYLEIVTRAPAQPQLPVQEVVLGDNNGQLAVTLKRVEIQLSANPRLTTALVLKGDNGVMNDASVEDAEWLLQERAALYHRLLQYRQEGRFKILRGPASHGTPLDRISRQVAAALLKADVVFVEGEANSWMVNGLNRPMVLAFRLKWPLGTRRIVGLDPDFLTDHPPAFIYFNGRLGRYYDHLFSPPSRRLTIEETWTRPMHLVFTVKPGQKVDGTLPSGEPVWFHFNGKNKVVTPQPPGWVTYRESSLHAGAVFDYTLLKTNKFLPNKRAGAIDGYERIVIPQGIYFYPLAIVEELMAARASPQVWRAQATHVIREVGRLPDGSIQIQVSYREMNSALSPSGTLKNSAAGLEEEVGGHRRWTQDRVIQVIRMAHQKGQLSLAPWAVVSDTQRATRLGKELYHAYAAVVVSKSIPEFPDWPSALRVAGVNPEGIYTPYSQWTADSVIAMIQRASQSRRPKLSLAPGAIRSEAQRATRLGKELYHAYVAVVVNKSIPEFPDWPAALRAAGINPQAHYRYRTKSVPSAAGLEEHRESLSSFLEGLTPAQRRMRDYLTGAPGTQVFFPMTEDQEAFQLTALGLDPDAVRKFIPLLAQNPLTVQAHWEFLTGTKEVEIPEFDEGGKEVHRYHLPELGLDAASVRKQVPLLGRNPRTIASHWEHLVGLAGTPVTLMEKGEDGRVETYTLPELGLDAASVRKQVSLLGRNPRMIASHWEYLTGSAGTPVVLTEKGEDGRSEMFTLPALGLDASAVRKEPRLLGWNPRTIASHWEFLTGTKEVEIPEFDGGGQEVRRYHLNALGLDAGQVRKSIPLLTQNPRTIASHWEYLTGYWPRLVTIVRRTPSYLIHSLWNQHALRASYLAVLGHRWAQVQGGLPLPKFIDLTRVHSPLMSSAARFERLFPRLGGVVQTEDWGLFQEAWPLLVWMHQEVAGGAGWDQDWVALLHVRKDLPKQVKGLLASPSWRALQSSLFTNAGRLRDPTYQIPWPLPAAGLEEGVVRQGRVVVVDAALVEQNVGLEEFLRRLEGVAPYADRVILLGPGSWDRIQTVHTEQELDVLLSALEERIPSLSLTYVGLEERVPHLQALLRGHPNVTFYTPRVSGANLLALLTAGLNLPKELAGELATGLEEAEVRGRAA